MARVQFLAHLADTCGCQEVEIEAGNVQELLAALSRRFGAEFDRKLQFSKVLVNGVSIATMRLGKTPLSARDEVSILPPVAGG